MPDKSHFNLDRAIQEWRRQLRAAGIRKFEWLNELESHLRDDIAQALREGVGAKEAFEAARSRMGQAHALRDEFRKVATFGLAVFRKLKAAIARLSGSERMPVFANFNASGHQTLTFAREEAPGLHHHFIGTEHLLLGLLRADSGGVGKILQSLGVTREIIRKEIIDFVGMGVEQPPAATIPYTPRAKNALAIASREAKTLKHSRVGPEHIFLGLLIEGDGVAARVLQRLGIEVEKTRETIVKGFDLR